MPTLDSIIERLSFVSIWLGKIQSILDFHGWMEYPQFVYPKGLGRVAFLACTLGIAWTFHGGLVILLGVDAFDLHRNGGWLLSSTRWNMLWQWCLYTL